MKDSFSHIPERVCPRCGAVYRAPEAISRVDNKTPICPACGVREALASLGCTEDQQEHILEVIRSCEERRHEDDQAPRS